MIEDLLRELTRPFMTEGVSLHISASLGVAGPRMAPRIGATRPAARSEV